jgi:hypothetical protein
MNKILLLMLALSLSLFACSPAVTPPMDEPVSSRDPLGEPNASPEPGAPPAEEPASGNWMRGNVYVDFADILTRESMPPQYALVLQGNLPTPCHQLQVEVSEPNAENRIDVNAYSLVDADVMCLQVLQAFEETVTIGVLPAGNYSLWLNGEMVGEFVAP